jgi:Loader and inhibitor of phage G40P
MTKKEMAQILMQIYALYPNNFPIDSERLPMMVEVWYNVLGKQSFEETMKMLNRYATENRFPPAPADLYIRNHPAYRSNVVAQIKQWEREAVGKQC